MPDDNRGNTRDDDRGPSRGGGRDSSRGGGGRGGDARGPRGEFRGGDRRDSRPQGSPDENAAPIRIPGTPDDLPAGPPVDAEDEMDFAGHALRDVLTLLGLTETEIAARDPESAGDGAGLVSQVLDIYGETPDVSEELGVLIGRRGETLTALQYLLNVMVSTRYGNDHVFGLDIEQYRHRREQTLIDMAKRIAAEVRETGDVITLEPMPASERRIVHLTLEAEAGVRTESVGSGADRQVEVLPDEGA